MPSITHPFSSIQQHYSKIVYFNYVIKLHENTREEISTTKKNNVAIMTVTLHAAVTHPNLGM